MRNTGCLIKGCVAKAKYFIFLKPDIGSKPGVKSTVPDYISYTVSAPSGRATQLFSRGEQDGMYVCITYMNLICPYQSIL